MTKNYIYLKSNLGDQIRLNFIDKFIFNWKYTKMSVKLTNPYKPDGAKTTYLKLLEMIESNPGIKYSQLIKYFRPGTVNEVRADFLEYGLITTGKDGYYLTEDLGEYYLYLIRQKGFKEFKIMTKFSYHNLVIDVIEPATKRTELDKLGIELASSGAGTYTYVLSLEEFHEFLEVNNYKLNIYQDK